MQVKLITIYYKSNDPQKNFFQTAYADYGQPQSICRVCQIPLFLLGKCLKKNYWIFAQISVFYLKVQSIQLIMENNVIQMAAFGT